MVLFPQSPREGAGVTAEEASAEEAPVASVSIKLPRQAESLSVARGNIRAYVRACRGDDALVYAAQLAASEVVTAFLEGDSEQIGLTLDTVSGHIEVTVDGFPQTLHLRESELRSRILDALTDDVTITMERLSEHVTVRLSFSTAAAT
jgi:hypothetical protein